jgi:riboflavin transporter FmnP
MHLAYFFLVFLSHALAALPFFSATVRGRVPRIVDFACVSMLLYYDSGLALEIFARQDAPFGLTRLMDSSTETRTWALLLLMVAPWTLRLGALVANTPYRVTAEPSLRPDRRRTFFVLCTSGASVMAAAGFYLLLRDAALWLTRNELGEGAGPWAILLYVPSYVLASFVTVQEARTRVGLFVGVLLMAASMIATAAIGQRTLLLVPLLYLFLFRPRTFTARRLIIAAGACIVAAAVLLPLFKWQYASDDFEVSTLLEDTINIDFNRAATLASAIEQAPIVGTRVMHYPLEGYAYAVLFFFPRSMVPFKGESTAAHFTASTTHEKALDLQWGFGIGVIEEAVANSGLAMAPLVLLMVGLFLGGIERLVANYPLARPAVSLAALWSAGYHLPALLLTFGGGVPVAVLLSKLFAVRISDAHGEQE